MKESRSLVAWELESGVDGETLGNEGYVNYLDCGDDFKVVYVSKLIKMQTWNMCDLLYIITCQ